MFVQILQKPFRKNQNSDCQDNGNEDILRCMNAEIVAGKAGQQDQEYTEILSPVLKYPVATIGNHLLTDGIAVQISELSRAQMAEEKLKAGKQKKTVEPEKAGKQK